MGPSYIPNIFRFVPLCYPWFRFRVSSFHFASIQIYLDFILIKDLIELEILRRAGVDTSLTLKHLSSTQPDNHFAHTLYGARLMEQGQLATGFHLYQSRLLLSSKTKHMYPMFHDVYQFFCEKGIVPEGILIDCIDTALGDFLFFLPSLFHFSSLVDQSLMLRLSPLQLSIVNHILLPASINVVSADSSVGDSASSYVLDLISLFAFIPLDLFYQFRLTDFLKDSILLDHLSPTLPRTLLLPFAREKLRRTLYSSSESLDLSRRSLMIPEISTVIDQSSCSDITVGMHSSDLAFNGLSLDTVSSLPFDVFLFPDDPIEALAEFMKYQHLISADTAMFHLTARFSLSCQLILPQVTDWRYGQFFRSQNSLLWYPTVSLYPHCLPL